MNGKSLGFGVGFRPDHYLHVTEYKPRIDWLEVISENFMGVGGRPLHFLEKARADYPVVLHGVGLSIGSKEPLNRPYLMKLKELVRRVAPPFVSDHLCWTSHGGHNSHDLLPVPYTEKFLQLVADKVQDVQDFLQQRFFLENPSAYVAFAHNDMSEVEFFRELCARTGCGMLLDVNNLFVNHSNLGLDTGRYLATLREEDIGYFHLAGHSVNGEVRIDTHDHPVVEEVWQLYEQAVQKWPDAPTLVEWDDNIPEFARLMEEAQVAKQRHAAALKNKDHKLEPAPVVEVTTKSLRPEDREQGIFFNFLQRPEGVDDSDPDLKIFARTTPVPAEIGINVYNSAYFLRLRDTLKNIFETVYYVLENHAFDKIAAAYILAYPPTEPSIDAAGKNLARFLADANIPGLDVGVPMQVLGDIAALDWARAELFVHPTESTPLRIEQLQELTPELWETIHFELTEALHVLALGYNIGPVWRAAHNDMTPERPDQVATHFLVYRTGHVVSHRSMDSVEAELLAGVRAGKSFKDATQDAFATLNPTLEATNEAADKATAKATNEAFEAFVQTALGHLNQWFTAGLVCGMHP